MTQRLDKLKKILNEDVFTMYRLPTRKEVHVCWLEEYKEADQNDFFAVRGFNDEMESRFSVKLEETYTEENFQDLTILSGFSFPYLLPEINTTEAMYKKAVNDAIGNIQEAKFKKVVLARCLFEPIETPNITEIFKALLADKNAFVYIFSHPTMGTWAGASPEYLLLKNKFDYNTMALAGTRVKNTGTNWSLKEEDEQQVVVQFVEDVFRKHHFSNVDTGKSFTITTGVLQHICSEITGQVSEHTDIQAFISDLHPTPALGGYPKIEALEFIKENESFERQLYGGYLGRHTKNELHLYVNIRCMRLAKNGIQYFAGAGINEASNADKEWIETNNKLATMQGVIASLQVKP